MYPARTKYQGGEADPETGERDTQQILPMIAAALEDRHCKHDGMHQAGGKHIAGQAQVTPTQAVLDVGKVGLADPGNNKQHHPTLESRLLTEVAGAADPVQGIGQHGGGIRDRIGKPVEGLATQTDQQPGEHGQQRAGRPVTIPRNSRSAGAPHQ